MEIKFDLNFNSLNLMQFQKR